MTAADVIIIGSGPGGSYLARQLASSGRRVTILERGAYHAATDNSLTQVPMLNMVFTDGINSLLRGLTAGGSTMLYFGSVISPPYAMFEKHGVDLRSAEKAIRAELPNAPLPEELLSEQAQVLMTAGQSLGLDWQPLTKFIHQHKLQPGKHSTAARWNARELLAEAVTSGANFITEARVEKINYIGGRVLGVTYKKSGQLVTLDAPLVISAAGGIGSASLFSQSGISISEGFFCDPLIAVLGASDSFRQTYEPLPMLAGTLDAENGIMLTDMPLPWPIFSAFALQTLRPDLLFNRDRTLMVMVKVRDELAGEITAHDKVRRRLTPNDKRLIELGTGRAESVLCAAGVKKVAASAVTSAHPGGSIRLGDRLDENLQSEIQGLYVCDASVIPEAFGLPPTLTLLSLARRLADHLLEKF
jgi:choline dehydrogenase-like flavoprotein